MSSSAPAMEMMAHAEPVLSPSTASLPPLGSGSVPAPSPAAEAVAINDKAWPEPVFPDPNDLISEAEDPREVWPEPVFPDPNDLISEDDQKLETPFHRANMNLLIESLSEAWSDRQDFYTGGNMFLYYSSVQAKNKDYSGPDFFVVNQVPRLPARPYWAVWEEGGRYPDVIVELTSPSTRREDLGNKFRIYEQIFRTHEYFYYEPRATTVSGWRLVNHQYQPIVPDPQGRLFSEQLGMSLGIWTGSCLEITEPARFLRLFDADGNVVPTGKEREAIQRQLERQRADAESQRADAAAQLAEAAAQRADNEAQRADSAEQELEQLRALVAKLQGGSASSEGVDS